MTRTRLLLPALALLTLVTACTATDPTPPTGPGAAPAPVSRGIDARAYAEEYESDVVADAAGPTTSLSSAGGAAAPSGSAGRAAEPGDVAVPGLLDDNVFVDAGTSGFVEVADDPASTFGLDVDTGSFGVGRTLLEQGLLPPAASVRPEEWVNAVTSPLPPARPADGDDLAVTATSAPAQAARRDAWLVRVGVDAREIAPEDRPRVDVTLVVDRSGSMDLRDRLGLVRSSLALLADRLRDDDTVAVVGFEDEAVTLLDPTPVADTDAVLATIGDLRPGGSTNLEAGLVRGYELARARRDPEAVPVVVLASDGVANVGVTGPDALTAEIAEAGREGIHLVTVGYGMGNYDDHLMEQLADLGDGFHAYVDSYAEAERLFADRLTTTLVPVAAQARAQVAFDPGRVTSYRLVGYENRAMADEDFTDLDVDAGELGAGHRTTALYEVVPAPGVEPGDRLGTASVRWESTGPDGGAAREADVPVTAPRAGGPDAALALAAATADLAEGVKRRDLVLVADARDRARALATTDAGTTEGAVEVARLADLALRARPAQLPPAPPEPR